MKEELLKEMIIWTTRLQESFHPDSQWDTEECVAQVRSLEKQCNAVEIKKSGKELFKEVFKLDIENPANIFKSKEDDENKNGE